MPCLQTVFQSLYPSPVKAKEMLGMRLCVMHNLYFYNTMMTEIRDALDKGEFAAYKKRKLDGMQRIVYDGK